MSSLTSTNIKLDSEKVELLKMKGVNVSAICREAIDSYLTQHNYLYFKNIL